MVYIVGRLGVPDRTRMPVELKDKHARLFTAANGGWEYPAFLILASVAHGLIGDGALALRSRPLLFWQAGNSPVLRSA